MTFIKILSIIAVIVSAVWLILKPDFEPLTMLLASIITTITLFFIENRKTKQISQKQEISHSSTGIQAGGNVSIQETGENIYVEKKERKPRTKS